MKPAEFTGMMLPFAVEASNRTDIDPRIIIAQSALETGWGEHAPGNNFFGIKSHGKPGGNTLATTEVVNGRPVTRRASFRQYSGPAESAAGYADFITSNPRYRPTRQAQGLDAQIAALGESGYATDPRYADKIRSIVDGLPIRMADSGQIASDATPGLRKVTDPDLLRRLNAGGGQRASEPTLRKVTDPALLERLNAGQGGGNAQPPVTSDQGGLSGVLDMFTQGLTLGQGRKLTALENAILGGTEDESFWQEYDRFLASEGAQQEAFREESPVTATLAEIGGAVAPVLVSGGVAALPRGAGAAGRVASGMMRATPASVAARVGMGGATRGAQLGRAALSGAAAGAVYGESEAEQGSARDRLASAVEGAGFGVLGGVAGHQLGVLGGRILSRVVGNKRYFDGNKLTEAGRRALGELGVDPELVSDDFARAWASRIKQAGGSTDEALRMATADEFGIPLTRGQATGDEAQIAFEEAARNNARGAMAQSAVRSIDDTARERVGEAVDTLAGSADDTLEAAERTGGIVTEAARRARMAGTEAYDRAAAAGPAVVDARAVRGGTIAGEVGDNLPAPGAARAFRGIVERASTALREVTLGKPAGKAASALDELRTIEANVAGAPEGSIGVDFSAIERVRSKLLANQRNLSRSDPQAAEEVGSVVGALDEWTEDAFDNALITGSPETLAALKEARAAWKNYRQKFGTYKGKDADLSEAQRFISQIAERDMTPQEIAGWLWGASKTGAKGASVRTIRRLKKILPADDQTEAMTAIKAGVWRNITEARTADKRGYQNMATRIKDFLSGDGRAMARELFTPGEIARMTRFAKALDIMVPPRSATNPSNTAYGIARLGQDMVQAMGASMGFAAGGPAGGIGAMIAGNIAQKTPGAVRAFGIPARRALTTGASGLPRGGGAVVGGAGASVLETRNQP